MEKRYARLGHAKAIFIFSINFAIFLTASLHASQQEHLADEPLSSQSQRFWQSERQLLDQPAAVPALQAPIHMRTGRSINQEHEEELQRRMYRQAFNEVLSRDLSVRAQVHAQRFLRYLEERVSDEVKQCLPVRLVEKISPFLINTYKFQLGDSPIESSKKLTQLGLEISNTPLLLGQAEKNNLAALAFSTAGYRALKMEDDLALMDKCDFYLSVSQLFIWGSHRYQNLWAKRFMLDKASSILAQAILAFEYVTDPDKNLTLSRELVKEFLNILGRYQEV